MGGRGSGHQGPRKLTVEQVPRFDLKRAIDTGALVAGHQATWPCLNDQGRALGWLDFEVSRSCDAIAFTYQLRGQERTARARLSWMPLHFGGARPYLECPACSGRALVLFFPWGACRACAGLAYRSTQRNHDVMWVARQRLVRAWARLGIEFDEAERAMPENHHTMACCRATYPRGMSRARFDALWKEAQDALAGVREAARESMRRGGIIAALDLLMSGSQAITAPALIELTEREGL